MHEGKDYVTRKEIEKLCHEPGTFAQNMDDHNLERVLCYFVDELNRRQEQRRLKDF